MYIFDMVYIMKRYRICLYTVRMFDTLEEPFESVSFSDLIFSTRETSHGYVYSAFSDLLWEQVVSIVGMYCTLV